GQEVNAVPPAMVHEGDILRTGVSYGNAVVMTQPKRGCAGPRCDGQVCKILHDPEVPPPHQYLATYRWLDKGFDADVLIHVGTHGNLEFLPGKGVGLSESCLPDLTLGETPHLYIYNSDNPPEGTIAKRRSNAVLVDHMQTVMTQGGLYDDLEELDRLLAERDQAKLTDRARAHALEHMILDLAAKLHLDKEVRLKDHKGFEAAARALHESLARIRATQIQDGMHVFGEIPQGERRVDFMRSILRFDAEDPRSLRKTLCRLMGLDLKALLAEPGAVDQRSGQSHGRLLERVETLCGQTIAETLRPGGDPKAFVRRALDLGPEAELKDLDAVRQRVLDLNDRIEASREIDSLLNGMSGGHIQAGPSGVVTRGRDDILPTGRNFYSLDPRRVPTKAAYRVGQQLAHALLEKHVKEEGRLPENVAMYWMCNDIMWSDGEGMAQIFALLGVRPKWAPDGRVSGVEVVPLEELGRPRVDVTIRVSGLIRDNFPGCMDLIDDAVRAAAEQNEPLEMNFVRKHALDDLSFDEDSGDADEQWRKATLRLFAAKPGCYLPGVNLAVYASAWKDESDLADIFVTWNGYAYGRDVPGEPRQEQLINRLKTVDVTFNKVISDEHDLFGCCCYFGSHGGMTAAARHLAGHEVRTYYGDTREPEQVEVRDLADEIRRVVRTKLLNPKWIEGMKRHGYKGAMDISKRVGRVYGWESTTQEVDDWIFDDIARTFVLDDENREFFRDNNPWALEEIGRRLLEAEGRGLWQADQEVLEGLREAYLEMEGWLEESMGEVDGDFQGGSVDVYSPAEVQAWETYMRQRKTKDTQGS
ncbi:MAG: cobaltochelatase subunit CobN, partial [Desulfovibrionaceae bacterium]|nr:cobaltochelatase subunit CobN [Desulfovibrionaceae bacterium]